MVFVSLTRLRLRSIRLWPVFAVHAVRTRQQLVRSDGFVHGALLPDGPRTFWTITAWDSAEAMRTYMLSGAHRAAMPKLMHWCDEASLAHWEQEDSQLPSWTEADRRMRQTGRISKVLHPSPDHAGMSFAPPVTVASVPVRRV